MVWIIFMKDLGVKCNILFSAVPMCPLATAPKPCCCAAGFECGPKPCALSGIILWFGCTVRRSNPGTSKRFFLISRIPALGPSQPPIRWVTGLVSVIKRPERDADHSPSFSAVVTTGWSCASICLRGVCQNNLHFTVGLILTKFCVRPFLVLSSPHFSPCIKLFRNYHDELRVGTGTAVNALPPLPNVFCSRHFQSGKPSCTAFMPRISLFQVGSVTVSLLRW